MNDIMTTSLSPCFFEIFSDCPDSDKKVSGDGSQARVYVDDARQMYYFLASEQSGACRLEFWVDTYARDRVVRQKLLQRIVSGNLRTCELVSYYSALGCRLRARITNCEELKQDVSMLRRLVFDLESASVNCDGTLPNLCEDRPVLQLPCSCSLKELSRMLIAGSNDVNMMDKSANRLMIPAIQRGKVWNAARIEALWDSIFREIPIGALSVRKRKDDERSLDLLDGQQRATAISLGYSNFPGEKNRFDSVLWIDLKKKDSKHYRFFVTTASQPWGYADSGSETRNTLLPLNERRDAAKSVVLTSEQVKPYAYQLYPVRGFAPVPYVLLREYAEKTPCDLWSLDGFIIGLKGRVCESLADRLHAWAKCPPMHDEAFAVLCEKVLKLSEEYSVFLLDAASVADEDIALYFTRIGKGGVVPSDEEMAYSVLKSKLDDDGVFRDTIERLHAKYGIAAQARIAHLAIRLFKSIGKDRPSFFSGSVFSAAVEMCREENARQKEQFAAFIRDEFENIVDGVYQKTRMTKWHLLRYASARNGDVFLFMMLAHRYEMYKDVNVDGIAALLFGFAARTDFAIKKILDEGLRVGLARLRKDTYYGVRQMTLPPNLAVFESLDDMSGEELIAWKAANPAAAEFVAEGYFGSPHGRMLCMLVYACRDSQINNHFDYDPNLGLWSEENCPWDYDHIMPHSVIENMKGDSENDKLNRSVCEWLKNSIGNLAPLPFSINRSLSDSVRDARYPFCGRRQEPADSREQVSLHVNGAEIAEMWKDGALVPQKFVRMTIRRFVRIYETWCKELGIAGILDFSRAFTGIDASAGLKESVLRRYQVYQQIAKKIPNVRFMYIADGHVEEEIPEDRLYSYFAAEDWLTVAVEFDGLSVAVCRERSGGKWEVGFRKSSEASHADPLVRKRVETLLADDAAGAIKKSTLCPENDWWYVCDELAECDDIADRLVDRMKTLIELLRK